MIWGHDLAGIIVVPSPSIASARARQFASASVHGLSVWLVRLASADVFACTSAIPHEASLALSVESAGSVVAGVARVDASTSLGARGYSRMTKRVPPSVRFVPFSSMVDIRAQNESISQFPLHAYFSRKRTHVPF